MSSHGTIEHLGFEVDDLDASVSFLTNTFSVEVERTLDIPDRLRAAFLRWGDTTIELIELTGEHDAPRRRIEHVAIAVDDLDGEVARLHAAGIATETPTPVELGGRRSVFVDGSAHGFRVQIVGVPA